MFKVNKKDTRTTPGDRGLFITARCVLKKSYQKKIVLTDTIKLENIICQNSRYLGVPMTLVDCSRRIGGKHGYVITLLTWSMFVAVIICLIFIEKKPKAFSFLL